MRRITMSENHEEHPTKSWSLISSAMIGVTITILALMWQFEPIGGGMVISTNLLMIALILFVNATTVNEKVAYEQKKGSPPEVIDKWVHFAEYSFGLAFTLYISTFALLGYAYLKATAAITELAIIAPIAFLGVTWLIIVIYAYLDSDTGRKLPSKKRLLYIALEAAALVFIILDFMGLIIIP